MKKVGGAYVSKGKGKAHGTQKPKLTPGAFSPAGRKRGKSSSSSKYAKMYDKAMKHQI